MALSAPDASTLYYDFRFAMDECAPVFERAALLTGAQLPWAEDPLFITRGKMVGSMTLLQALFKSDIDIIVLGDPLTRSASSTTTTTTLSSPGGLEVNRPTRGEGEGALRAVYLRCRDCERRGGGRG